MRIETFLSRSDHKDKIILSAGVLSGGDDMEIELAFDSREWAGALT